MRYTIQLSHSNEELLGPQVVVVWLDRKRPPGEEAVEVTEALIKKAIDAEENVDSHSKTRDLKESEQP